MTRGVAHRIGAGEREGHDVDPAVGKLPGDVPVHAQPAGGRGHGTADLARQCGHFKKAGVEQRFAPALQVHAARFAHQQPGRSKVYVHVARARHWSRWVVWGQ
jgi:hypothetical protein